MSHNTRKWASILLMACTAFFVMANVPNSLASTRALSTSGMGWAESAQSSRADASEGERWLLAGLAVVGLSIVSGAAGFLAASVARLAGMAAVLPGTVGGMGVGLAFYVGGTIAVANSFSTSGGTTTSTLSSFLNLLFGSTGSGSSGSVIPNLLATSLLASLMPVVLLLSILGAAGIGIALRMRRRVPGTASPLGGLLGGVLGLGIAFGAAAGANRLVVANAFTGEVSMVDVSALSATGVVVDSVIPHTSEALPTVSSVEVDRGDSAPTSTSAAADGLTAGPTVTVLQPEAGPTVTLLQPANCRFGPGTIYPIATSFVQGRVLPITGRSEIGEWWQVSYTGDPGVCWVAGSVVEPNGNLSGVPTVIAPATPTPTEPSPQPQQPGTQGCLVWVEAQKQFVCKPRVCGDNDPKESVPCWY